MPEAANTNTPTRPRDPNRPHGCTCFRLRRTTRQVTRIYDTHLLPVSLTLSQYSILSNLMRGGPPSVNGMAELLGMDRTTLTRTLKPLIAAKLLALETGDDRRSKRIALTAQGRDTWERAVPLWRAAQAEIESKLGTAQVKMLHDLLDTSFTTLNDVA
ncbi:MAG TPA: MarR family winged helix-turn-helix transcriptional regulator [Magnetospirillaceae bacterium]|jgi:DNA-binding MarR family transcriptional regulator